MVVHAVARTVVAGAVAGVVFSPGARAQIPDTPRAYTCDGRAESSPIYAEDRLSCYHLDTLHRGSPTLRQMLRVLESTHWMAIRIRSSGLLWRSWRIGQGMFAVSPEGLIAVLEFDMVRSDRHVQLEAVAHELAHVVELACLPDLPPMQTADDLRQILEERGRVTLRSRVAQAETPFALDAGRQAAGEVRARSRDSRLRALSMKHGLGGACLAEPGETVAAPASTRF